MSQKRLDFFHIFEKLMSFENKINNNQSESIWTNWLWQFAATVTKQPQNIFRTLGELFTNDIVSNLTSKHLSIWNLWLRV